MKPHTRPRRRVALDPGALQRAREDAGLNVTTLAERAGISYSHLLAVEAGKEGISPERLADVASVLRVSIADLRAKEQAHVLPISNGDPDPGVAPPDRASA
jgi:transcriptional regulator with XRE-family HTH domain